MSDIFTKAPSIFFISLMFVMSQLSILNGLRYFKYKKILFGFTGSLIPSLIKDKEILHKADINYAKSFIAGGVLLNIFFYIFLIFTTLKSQLFLILVLLWPLTVVIILYWYWHTEKDPFGDFEFELKGM